MKNSLEDEFTYIPRKEVRHNKHYQEARRKENERLQRESKKMQKMQRRETIRTIQEE